VLQEDHIRLRCREQKPKLSTFGSIAPEGGKGRDRDFWLQIERQSALHAVVIAAAKRGFRTDSCCPPPLLDVQDGAALAIRADDSLEDGE
jgi:hypothetical protein